MRNVCKYVAISAMAFSSSSYAATMQLDMATYDVDISAGTFDVVLSAGALEPASSPFSAGTVAGSESITFDPAILSVSNVVFSADLGTTISTTSNTDVAGQLVLEHPTLNFGGLPADINIATITFNILGTGTTSLALASPTAIPGGVLPEQEWVYEDAAAPFGVAPYCITHTPSITGRCTVTLAGEVPVTFEAVEMVLSDSVVNVSAIPLPPAVWLFGTGLLGLVGIARRRVQK
jgi:hypothetical protein